MAQAVEEHEAYDELDLGEILRELFRWKWTLIGVTILVGVLAVGFSLTKPNLYESSAALIVREPPRAIDRNTEDPAPQDVPTLTVETLQALTESTEITWTLFETLLEKGAVGIDAAKNQSKEGRFREFQGTLRTEIKKQQSRGAGGSDILPILILKAQAESPDDAERIANEWASLVETRSSEIYTKGVEALGAFIGDMYKKSNESLETLESNLAEKELEASLTLKKARLATLTKKISMLEDEMLDIDIELAVNKVAIEEGEARIQEQRVDNEWIGTVAEDALLKNEPYPFPLENLSDQAKKVLELSEQKVRQTEALRKFRREQNLLGKEKRFEHSQLDMERILAEKAQVDDELPAVETALSALTEQLKDITETITLNKAITDDALWDLYINRDKGESPNTDMLVPLKSETLNPLYQSTRETIVELTSKAETLRGSTVQLERSEEAVMKLTEELESEIDMITEELDRRTTALEATKTSLALLRDDYLEEAKVIEELTLKNLRSQADRKTRGELRDSLTEEADILGKSISDFELQIAALTRESDKTKNVRTALASKAEEVALLEFSTENATQTGTAILYHAQANPNKVAPSRSKLVLMAMVGSFLACSLLICGAKFVREAE